MSFSDSLENDLKNLEARDERDPVRSARERRGKGAARARDLAVAPYAEKLKRGKFTADLLTHATRIGHGLRTKVNLFWLGTTLRLQAREHRLELVPTPDGVVAHHFVGDKETRQEKVDLNSSAEKLARRWLDTVGPRPAPEPIPDVDE